MAAHLYIHKFSPALFFSFSRFFFFYEEEEEEDDGESSTRAATSETMACGVMNRQ